MRDREGLSERTDFKFGYSYVEGQDILVRGETDLLRVVETGRTDWGLESKVAIEPGIRIFGIHGKIVEMSPEEEARKITIRGRVEHSVSKSPRPDQLFPNAICINQEPNTQGLGRLNVWLDPDEDNPLRFINHSCDPNAARLGPYVIKSVRKIEPKDAVTVDYSTLEVNPDWKMECKCGSSDCREEIRSVHFLTPKQIQKFWDGLPRFMKLLYLESAEERYKTVEDIKILEKLKKDREGL